jgi:hypothetical protein
VIKPTTNKLTSDAQIPMQKHNENEKKKNGNITPLKVNNWKIKDLSDSKVNSKNDYKNDQ